MTMTENNMTGKRTNIWLSTESDEAIQAIYEHLAKQNIYYDYKGKPNASAIIEYALRRVQQEITEERTPPLGS